MARMTIKGLDDWSTRLQNMAGRGEEIMKAAVYAGAGVLAEAVVAEINTLPEQQGYMPKGELRNVVTRDEKAALLSHIGIAKMDSTGGAVTTAIGFNGYSDHATKKYPSGVPVPLIARSIESGSSVRRKIPFLRNAANKSKGKVQNAMREAAEKAFEELGR